MQEWAGYVFVFCLLSVSAIFMFLAVFALAEPRNFIRWFWPMDWAIRNILRQKDGALDVFFARLSAFFSMSILLALAFVMGGCFVTAIFNLWNSPYSDLVFP